MEAKTFKIQAYSKKELGDIYRVSLVTLNKWISGVQDLGNYVGKRYTPLQVQKIVDHLGTP